MHPTCSHYISKETSSTLPKPEETQMKVPQWIETPVNHFVCFLRYCTNILTLILTLIAIIIIILLLL